MKNNKTYLFLALLSGSLFLGPSQMLSAADVSQEEFAALEKRVEELEAALQIVRNKQVEEIATEAFAALPVDQVERDSLINSVVTTIQAKEESANFPWMDMGKWSKLEKGMSPESVVAILGKPTLDEPSLHKRVDNVYTYQGRRVATAKKVEGIVRFYKGRVIEIEVPEL